MECWRKAAEGRPGGGRPLNIFWIYFRYLGNIFGGSKTTEDSPLPEVGREC